MQVNTNTNYLSPAPRIMFKTVCGTNLCTTNGPALPLPAPLVLSYLKFLIPNRRKKS